MTKKVAFVISIITFIVTSFIAIQSFIETDFYDWMSMVPCIILLVGILIFYHYHKRDLRFFRKSRKK